MTNLAQTLIALVEPIGIAVMLVYLYGLAHRKTSSEAQNQVWMGTAFGVAAAIGMLSSIVVTEGTIFDLRNLFVGLSAAFFGWRGMACALLIAGLTRIGIGGAGTFPGLVGMSIAAVMGWLWAFRVEGHLASPVAKFGTLSAMISLHLLGLLTMPKDIAWMLLTDLAPQLVVLNIFGTFLLGGMIYREQALIGESRELWSAATTDPLTKVMNRRSAIARYDRMTSNMVMPRGLAMLCIDIDNFKTINDTAGHLAGDAVLIEVAQRMSSCLRGDDIFCRMSGDEFVIVLANVASDEAFEVTERCRKSVCRAPVDFEDSSIDVSISVGAVWSATPKDFASLRDSADAALYRAKSSGRNRSAFVVSNDRGIRAPKPGAKVA